MANPKKVGSDLDINGKVITTGVQHSSGGSPTQVFKTDGTFGELNEDTASYNGFQYFKAAYKTGLTFLVTAEWRINGVLYLMRQQELTAPPADATFPRKDVIAVDDSGNIVLIVGTPAASPIKPTVDPVTQLEGTFYDVAANATTPTGTVVTNVYFENLGVGGGEYDVVSLNGRVVVNGAAINGSVGIEGTAAVSGDGVIATPAASFATGTVKQLNYLIRNKAAVTGKGDTHRFILNGKDGANNPVSITLLADPAYNQSILTPQFLSLTIPQDNSIVTIDTVRFAVTAKTAYGFFLDDIRFVATEVGGVEGKYATIAYVDERANFLEGMDIEDGVITGTASKNLALNRFNGQIINIPFTDESGGGGATAQSDLTDATTLFWDFAEAPLAYLLAIDAVGNVRTLPNSAIANGSDGATYQLTFVQDATGGRVVNFGSSYKVIGSFDLAPNKRTIISIVVQGTEADVILTPIMDPLAPQALTGTNLDISKYYGHTYNYAAPSASLSYTTENPVVNGFARCFINTASEPVVYETDGVTPATKLNGSPFTANTTMEMVVESPNGIVVEYYLIKR